MITGLQLREREVRGGGRETDRGRERGRDSKRTWQSDPCTLTHFPKL